MSPAYTPTQVLSPAAYATRLRAARRRVTIARQRANRNPTPHNLEAAQELEAGLHRIEEQAGVAA